MDQADRRGPNDADDLKPVAELIASIAMLDAPSDVRIAAIYAFASTVVGSPVNYNNCTFIENPEENAIERGMIQ